MSDPNWLYSTIAQSSAAIVAIVGGFITASVLSLAAEKRSLNNQKNDKEASLKTLKGEKKKLSNEYEPLAVQSFLEYKLHELIGMVELPSLEKVVQDNPETRDLNLTILESEYERLSGQIHRAKDFIGRNLDKINIRSNDTFDRWVENNNFDISGYDYEILEIEYARVKDEKWSSLPEFEQAIVAPQRMRFPYIAPIPEQQELDNLKGKIDKLTYEISALENDVASLGFRISKFSYPPNLGWSLFVLVLLALFGIIIPLLVIFAQAYSVTNSLIVMFSFVLGLTAFFIYLYIQVKALGRK